MSQSPFKKTKLKVTVGPTQEPLGETIGMTLAKKSHKKVQKYELNEFLVLSLLGYGTFGSVLLVKHSQTESPYALKIIKKERVSIYTSKKQSEHISNEIEVLSHISDFDNSYYPKLHDTMNNDLGVYLLLDFIPGGELFSYLRTKLTIEEWGIQFYMAEVIVALEQLHSENIIFRDLKPENLIIDKDGHIKLVDFGFSKFLKEGEVTYTS